MLEGHGDLDLLRAQGDEGLASRNSAKLVWPLKVFLLSSIHSMMMFPLHELRAPKIGYR